MSENIVVSIGKWGVKSIPIQQAFSKPQPGDPIDTSGEDVYPFNDKDFARIDGLDKWEEGSYHICMHGGSHYWREDGSVSISGGPFTCVYPDELIPTMGMKRVRFWNWGDNGSGAGHGVDYYVDRPIWRLKLRPVKWKCPDKYYGRTARALADTQTVKCLCCDKEYDIEEVRVK